MIIMGVDYGDARTGIAVCDKTEFMASPVTVITEYNQDNLVLKIAQKATELKAEEIVIGNPINMNGTVGSRSELAHSLADKVKAICPDTKVTMWDERSTTVSAAGFLNQADVRGKKRKAIIDAVAAVIILENYLAYRKNHQ